MPSKLLKKYIPIEVYYEDQVTLEVTVPISFDNFDDAKNFAYRGGSLYFFGKTEAQDSCLILRHDEKSWFLSKENVEIYVDENFYNRRSLDPKNPIDYEIIMGALDDPNSPYVLTKDDFTLVDWSFDHLGKVIGHSVKLSSLSWEVKEVDVL